MVLARTISLDGGTSSSIFAALGFFALFVGASRMVGAMSKNQIVQEVELTEVVERIGSINKNLQ